jgi:hypothetical protein
MTMSLPLPTLRTRALIGLAAVGLVLSACTTATGTPGPSPSAAAIPSIAPSVAASPSPSASPAPSASPKVTQTDTAWGRIWDAVPASFPVPAGASPVEPDRAASGAWSLSGGDAAAVTDAIRTGLEANGFTTAGVDGPLEDGSRIIDSTGTTAACHVQTRVTPTGTMITITVLYGAACPFR